MPSKVIEISELNAAIETRFIELGIDVAENKSAAARAIGVSRQRLDGWLRGSMPEMTAENQQLLARFLGVAPKRVLELAGLSLSSRASGRYLIQAA